MKGFVKKIICFGSVFGMVIGTVAYAGTLVKKVYFSGYPICIDGEEYASESPILSYQNRTYVSLREFSNMVGVDIDFKNDTIYISTNNKVDDSLINKKKDDTSDASTTNETKVATDESETTSSTVNVVLADDTTSQIVYVTASGTKYHSNKTCSGGTTFYSINLQEAKKSGYLPCSKCVNNL